MTRAHGTTDAEALRGSSGSRRPQNALPTRVGRAFCVAAGSRARFWCAWRWRKPAGELAAGKLTVIEGDLPLSVAGKTETLGPGDSAEAGPDGKVIVTKKPG